MGPLKVPAENQEVANILQIPMRKLTSLLLLIVFVWFGCSTTKPNTHQTSKAKSHYHIQRFSQNTHKDSAIIIGQVMSLDGQLFLNAAIKLNNKEIHKTEKKW